jgi:hypothetical protein
VNAEKTKYMVMSRDQNAGQNRNMHTDNKFFETVEQSKYLGKPLTNKNPFMKKLGADCNQGMLTIILCRIFCIPVCYPDVYRLRYTEL